MKIAYLDTHLVIWLYAGLNQKIPEVAKVLIETCDLRICPIVMLEIQYLQEIGRVKCSPDEVIEDLKTRIGLKVDDLPFELIIKKAIEIKWTRDPFDRILAAASIIHGYPLITKDEHILNNLELAIWDTLKPLATISSR